EVRPPQPGADPGRDRRPLVRPSRRTRRRPAPDRPGDRGCLRAGPVDGHETVGVRMSVSVFAADEQSEHPVDTIRWVSLAEQVLKAEGVRGSAELSVLFVDEAAMADLTKRFLGKDEATDVLAFPI